MSKELCENKETHESYGVLKFSRVRRSGNTHLFGSSIKHSDTIVMQVSTASMNRDLNSDWVMGEDKILECEMSYSQFAEAITSMNIGVGTPITLRSTQLNPNIEDCPFVDKRTQFEQEFKENLRKQNETANKLLNDVTELFKDKKTFNKGDKESILSMLNQLQMAIGSNQEFMYTQFNRQMDKTTREAKGEIEAFMQNKINALANLGLELEYNKNNSAEGNNKLLD